MNKRQLENFVTRKRNVVESQITKTPIILLDSKGLRLKNVLSDIAGFGNNIIWWCASGAKSEEQYQFLVRNLSTELFRHPNIVLYVWIGTCDLSTKEGSVLSLRTRQGNETVRKITDCYRGIKTFQSVEIVYLELPQASIWRWNQKHSRRPLSQAEKRSRFILITNLIVK